MPNASTTQASSASDTAGAPIPLAYGYVWVTGKRDAYWMLQNTGYSHMDFHRVGRWLLGHGEWDGPSELWINDVLAWAGNVPSQPPSNSNFSGQNWVQCLDNAAQPMVFNFHPGCDSVIGSGLSPSSSGPDQGVDVLCAQFPSAVQPLAYSRIAYYMLMRKQPLQNQTNTHQNDPTQWTDINPVGLWRALKCRVFDAYGNMVGYAFTTNPAWHIVDVILRRKLFPDYSLSLTGGPDPLPAAVSVRFDWGSFFEAAQYFDGFLANGRRRFTGNYTFASATSLQAILSKMLITCRSYLQEPNKGQITLNCDKPRPSVFIFSREHILPGTWNADDKNLNTSANRYIAQFRDLLVPAAAAIAGISAANQQNPEVTTVSPHPFNAQDRIAIGGTGTVYDGQWEVASVPPATNVGTPEESDPTTFTIVRKGANYPTSVGAGGAVGLLYSRFKNRSPEFWHKTNMLARGALGVGIARVRNKIKEVVDLDTTTYDQASRIVRYERDRRLGLDQTPYVTPPAVSFRTSMFAKDANGNLAAALRPGDRVTIDSTASWTYKGDYEVLEPMQIFPPTAESTGSGDGISQAPSSTSGEIALVLGQYDESYMYDSSDDQAAGWPSVPGSDPGNDTSFTSVDLANGGNFVFFTGQLPSGSQFQLPSTGYPSANMLAWAGPAGANINFHSMRTIQICDVDSTRTLSLIYTDDAGTQWGGDVNYAALTWLSPDTTFTENGITWLELTLLGGEKILFGKGVIDDGNSVQLPAGYTTDKMFAVAFPHDSAPSGYNAQSVGAYVDGGQVVHFDYDDSSSHTWPEPRNAAVLVFAWKNNLGTVTTQTIGPMIWMQITLANGKIFSVGCAKSVADGTALALPSSAGDGSTLETIVGSSNGRILSGHHAQGVGSCYLDQSNVVHITFNDGSGDVWSGQADVFAAFCVASSSGGAPPIEVTVTPSSASIGLNGSIRFVATVNGSSNQAVNWSVDGVAGGNAGSGTIDAGGNYTPGSGAATGNHTVTATSVASPSASASANVNVF